MAENRVSVELGDHPLTAATLERFPWARGQRPHVRAELNEVVSQAEHTRARWSAARNALGSQLSRLERSAPAAAGEARALVAEVRALLADAHGPDAIAEYAAAGRMSPGRRVGELARGARPANMRALEAIGAMRAGNAKLAGHCRAMEQLLDRLAAARDDGSGRGGRPDAPGAVRTVTSTDHPGAGRGAKRTSQAASARRGDTGGTRRLSGGRGIG
ncbi:hypothetical protein ACIBFB_18965 [Nocardiopsis sp. NPDC050513]|uniref:hypothetical protein n=1 Tax=Nocardiopsis sp. NPDC050513 TaxID=3364338 RepID=UPI0037BD092E